MTFCVSILKMIYWIGTDCLCVAVHPQVVVLHGVAGVDHAAQEVDCPHQGRNNLDGPGHPWVDLLGDHHCVKHLLEVAGVEDIPPPRTLLQAKFFCFSFTGNQVQWIKV